MSTTQASANDEASGINSNLPPEDAASASTTVGSELRPEERHISHSKNWDDHDDGVPRVIYANNLHLIGTGLFKRNSLLQQKRPLTVSGQRQSKDATSEKPSAISTAESAIELSSTSGRPPPPSHFPSWGATTVNTKFKEKVLRDVFSPPILHRRQRSRAKSARKPAPGLSISQSDISPTRLPNGTVHRRDERQISEAILEQDAEAGKDYASRPDSRGGSAPNQQVHSRASAEQRPLSTEVESKAASAEHRQIVRRRSGNSLQRKPCSVDSNKRSDLKYFVDDADRPEADEGIFSLDLSSSMEQMSKAKRIEDPGCASTRIIGVKSPKIEEESNGEASRGEAVNNQASSPFELAGPLSPRAEVLLNPVNPLQAQAQVHSDERVRHFLLLEDLTADMVKPCVLDLKMGTRQYGIEANAKKQASQRKKCQTTTSRQLGVRICGMQMWNVKKDAVIFEDKYAGRDLRAGKDFQSALRRFLFDGASTASILRHIPPLLEKLSKLEEIIKKLPRYRFYASSLLLLYDGAVVTTSEPGTEQSQQEAGGEAAKNTDPTSPPPTPATEDPPITSSTIDIRLVDFANCVTSQSKRLKDAPCPPRDAQGVDRGYIRGLRSVRAYLQRIWSEISSEEPGHWVERGESEGMALDQMGAGNRQEMPIGWRKGGDGIRGAEDDGEVSV